MKSKNIYFISLLTYFSIITVFITQVVIVRLLDISDYGVYAVIAAIISIIEAPLVTRGSELVLRIAGEKWNNGQREDAVAVINYVKKSERKMFWLVFSVLVVVSFVFFQFFDIDPLYLAILSFSIPMQVGFGGYKSFLTITNNVNLQSVIEVFYALFAFIAVYVGLTFFDIKGLLCALVISVVAKTQVSKLFYKKQLIKYSIDPEFSKIYDVDQVDFRKRSFNSMFRMFSQNSILQADIIILGMMQKPELVAVYKVGKSLAGLPTKVSIPVWKYLYPSLVKSVNLQDSKLTNSVIKKGSLIVALLFCFIYIGGWFVGEKMIQILYGTEYGDSYSIFLLLLIGYGAFYAVNGWFRIWVALIDEIFIGSIYYLVTLIFVIFVTLIFGSNLIILSTAISILMVVMVLFSYFFGLKMKGN